jgi:peptidoglycan/xylan/chitin deacetylase (PgdA/CDA1 family)
MLNPYKLTADLVAPLSHQLLRGTASIFTLHRFADRDRGNGGVDPDRVRADLAYLRRKRYDIVSLTELISRLRNRDSRLGKTVAFTVDDGYADFASVGLRVFAEYDCPVTVFLVTGVIDQGGWYWWDRLSEVLARTQLGTLAVDVGNDRFVATLETPEARRKTARSLIERLKRVPDVERRRVIAALENVLIDLPPRPPAEFCPMSWDEVRGCAQHGVTYGPHTIDHPILAQSDDASAEREIEGSWLRLREQTSAAVPIFCYPNGGPGDFSCEREPAFLRRLGFDGAVTTINEHASPSLWHSSIDAPFLVPRFGYNGNPAFFKQVITGVARARLAIRSRLRAARTR